MVAVLLVAVLLGLFVADQLVGRLAFATRQDHLSGAYNDPTVARPDRGAPELVMQVEELDVNLVVADGSSADILRGGPGLMTGSPLPGEPGNAVILGRSSRFDAPFGFVENLSEGAVIIIRQRAGQVAKFEVEDVKVVDADEFEDVVGEGVPIEGAPDDEPATLTLVTSAGGPLDTRRRVVTAKLAGLSAEAVASTGEVGGDGTAAAASGDDAAADPESTTTVPPADDAEGATAEGEAPATDASDGGGDPSGDAAVDTAEQDVPVRDPGTRPDGFDVRGPGTVLMLLGGLVIVGLGIAAVPELRRRHPTSTVVVVAAPAIALGVVLVLFSVDAVLPVTY